MAGQRYLITDYQTTYTQPVSNESKQGSVEPLVVIALASNKLSPIAFSPQYPQDVIYYDVNNDTTQIPGCTKGYIYRRIDTARSIDIPFDWRSVKFARWKIIPATWNDSTNYDVRAIVKSPSSNDCYVSIKPNNLNHAITNTEWWRPFEWEYGEYVSPTNSTWNIGGGIQVPVDNTATIDCSIFSILPTDGSLNTSSTIFNITIGKPSSSILSNTNAVFYGDSINNNVIGENFYNNSINRDFVNNRIMDNCNDNSFGSNCHDNSFGSYCNYNSFGYNCYSNSFGYNCYSNSFGSNCHDNSFGSNCNDNSFGSNCNYNSFGSYCYSNSFGSWLKLLSIHSGFESYGDMTNIVALYYNCNKTLTRRYAGEYDPVAVLIYINEQGQQVIQDLP